MRRFAFLLIFAFVIFASCAKNKPAVFEETEPLSLAPDVTWAVVQEPYVAFRENPAWESAVREYCRKGEVLKVCGSAIFPKEEDWYLFDSGWLPESVVALYSNRYKAQNAALLLK